MADDNLAVQRQTAVTAYMEKKQLLRFAFARHHVRILICEGFNAPLWTLILAFISHQKFLTLCVTLCSDSSV